MAPYEFRTPASLAVSSGLREARERRNIGVRELGRRLGFSPSRISSYELGANGPKPTTVSRILGCLHVNGAEYEQLMNVAEHTGVKNFVDHATSPVTDIFSIYEQLSSRIVEWAPFRIPDLLRTRKWLETTADGEVKPSDELAQEPFHQRFRRLPVQQEDHLRVFLIGDQALRMACEENAVQQIDFIREADKRKDVSIRFLPSLPGTGQPANPFTVFENGKMPMAVALRHEHCTAYLTDKSVRTSYHETAKALLRQASGESTTVEAWIASAYGRAA